MIAHDVLIEPSWVTVEQVNKAGTAFDTLAREPVKQSARAAGVELLAQVSWGRSYKSSRWGGGQGGEIDDASGYLVFAVADLDDAGVTLAKGDKVATIAGRTANVWLTSKVWAGHLNGAPTLEIWDIADKPLTAGR